jgi:hypothetical protein
MDGSGVIVSQTISTKKTPTIRSLRTTKIAGVLAYSDELSELLKPRCNAIIGHARWPTKGGVDIKAVHPHRFGHIIGVHNGTLYKVAGQDVPAGTSDSAMLFESFSKIGVEETMKDTRGAYALVWIDEQDQSINFLRNAERTLFFKNVGWNDNISTLFWSSEQEMLDFAFKRSYKGNNTWSTYLPIHKHFKYPLDVKHVIRPLSVTDVKPEEPKVSNWVGGHWRGRGTGGHNGNHHRSQGHAQGVTQRRELWNEQWPEADDLPWERLSDVRSETRPIRSSDGKVFVNGRWVEGDNVLRLPSPQNVEDRLKALAEKAPPEEPEKPVEANTATVADKPLSKQQQKRLAKQLAQEERDAKKRLQRFQVAQRVGRVINPPKEFDVSVDIESPDPLNDDISDVGLPANYTRNREETPIDQRIGRDLIRCVDRGCAWCGSVAVAGDNVFPTSSDVGSKDFVCYDCGNNEQVKPYLGQIRTAVVTN